MATIAAFILESRSWEDKDFDWPYVCEHAKLTEMEGAWIQSLFDEPIVWSEGHDTLTNGQHRVCGLKIAGAEAVPVRLL